MAESRTDSSGTIWRKTSGGNWRAENGPNKGKLYKNVIGAGEPTSVGGSPSAPSAPVGPLPANQEALDPSALQRASQFLQQQVLQGLITPQMANAELQRQVTQMAANNLQQQVASGVISQEVANREFARLQGISQDKLIAQYVNAPPIQTRYQQGIAVPGTKTKGTSLGDVREINAATVRESPSMQSAEIAPVTQLSPEQLAGVNQIGGQEVGRPELASGVVIGDTALAGQSVIDPMQQVGLSDSDYRARQMALASALEDQAAGRGPSLAELQIQQAMERSLKNEMGALSAQPGVSQALAARLYGQRAGEERQAAAMAGAQARMAEQIAARQQLVSLYEQGRGMDVGIQQANQAAINAASVRQAEIEAARQSQNAQLINETRRAQAALNQATEQFNAGLISQRQLEQAQMNYNVASANMQAANQRQLDQAELNTRIGLSNQLATNTQAYNQAQLRQAANQTNADIAAKRVVQQAQLEQEAAQGNQQAFNARNTAQGQISGGVQQASLGAGATVSAANAAANAAVQVANINQETEIFTNTQDNADDGSVIEAPTEKPRSPSSSGTTGGTSAPSGPSGTVGGGRDSSRNLVSDERAKKNISGGGTQANQMMEELAAAIFEYRDKTHGRGKQVGVMAQDLEKTKLGNQIVDNTKKGKSVSFARGLGAVLAAQAELHQRLKKLEGRG